VPKSGLVYGGQTLLQSTIDAVSEARHIVAVGDAAVGGGSALARVAVVRESPVFAGPAAAIAAGIEALQTMDVIGSDFTAVLACDMPRVANAVPLLFAAATGDGVVALSADGRAQQLVGVYSTALLRAAVAEHRETLENLSVRALLAALHPQAIAVPDGSTDDVDTWDDARRLGVTESRKPESLKPDRQTSEGVTVTDQTDEVLQAWADSLLAELGQPDTIVDIDGVLGLAGKVAHAVVRPAAPLTTYIVGYAVGRLVERGELTNDEAFARVAAAARTLAAATASPEGQQ
jgi:molybdopterin-guanine dinucleotide biosynthesis protein A